MSHQSYVGNYRRGSDEAEVTSPVSDVFEKGNLSRLPSSTTTNSFSSESTQKLKKSSQPDKAKQLMGLNITKSLSGSQRQLHCGDGNIAALESEYSDVLSPKRPTFPEKQDELTREKGPSTEEDTIKETARALYNGDESLVSLGDTASWLMTTSAFNSKVRTAYMELFDFMGLDILTAVRRLCAKLLLKGETQQLDRLLEALAKRWYECNPENGMKDPGTLH
jgi:Sec7-like guanine-nucleotide exchange factor